METPWTKAAKAAAAGRRVAALSGAAAAHGAEVVEEKRGGERGDDGASLSGGTVAPARRKWEGDTHDDDGGEREGKGKEEVGKRDEHMDEVEAAKRKGKGEEEVYESSEEHRNEREGKDKVEVDGHGIENADQRSGEDRDQRSREDVEERSGETMEASSTKRAERTSSSSSSGGGGGGGGGGKRAMDEGSGRRKEDSGDERMDVEGSGMGIEQITGKRRSDTPPPPVEAESTQTEAGRSGEPLPSPSAMDTAVAQAKRQKTGRLVQRQLAPEPTPLQRLWRAPAAATPVPGPAAATGQLYLNLGQKNFAHYTCPSCQMVFVRGRPEDDELHRRHHRAVLHGIHIDRVPPAVCVATDVDDSAILLVTADSPKAVLRKALELLSMVNLYFGGQPRAHSLPVGHKMFLFRDTSGELVACVVVEPLSSTLFLPHGVPLADMASLERRRAVCGIRRLWVKATHRRVGLATRLLDAVRNHFVFGWQVAKDQIAFAQPSADGRRFADAYIGGAGILVY